MSVGWFVCVYIFNSTRFISQVNLIVDGFSTVASLEKCKIQPGNFEGAETSYGCWQHLESFINTAAEFEKCSGNELQIQNVFYKSRW